jgi:hypothetical protein
LGPGGFLRRRLGRSCQTLPVTGGFGQGNQVFPAVLRQG